MSALTALQTQIADLAALGLSNDEIATELGLEPADVQVALVALFRAFGGSPSEPAPAANEGAVAE